MTPDITPIAISEEQSTQDHVSRVPTTADKALTAYGFRTTGEDSLITSPKPSVRTQGWIRPSGSGSKTGWLRFDPQEDVWPRGSGYLNGESWEPSQPSPLGRRDPDGRFPDRYQVPYGLLPEFVDVSGLSPFHNPQCYEWVWPDHAVHFMYAFTNLHLPNGKEWRKVTDQRTGEVRMEVVDS